MAGLTFTVIAPESYDIEGLLPSFAAFRVADAASAVGEFCRTSAAGMLFRLVVQPEDIVIPAETKLVEEDFNDMGHTRLSRTPAGRYCLELACSDGDGGIFMSDSDFSDITTCMAPDSPDHSSTLTSMLRIAFAQAIIRRDGISMHASSVIADGKSYLFLGKSGTGKSTHSVMWLRNIPGSRLLNDDNPAVRIIDGQPIAFGTPWSGKTPCYRNESAPVGGIVRLVQGNADIFTEKNDVEAFTSLLPSCSVVHGDAALQSRLCDTISRLAVLVPIGELECLPDDESAIICYNNLKSLIK